MNRPDEDTIQEIHILLPLTPAETRKSIMNSEFDEPVENGRQVPPTPSQLGRRG
jgi:hypothetical protein